jgi:hypothetical protein
MLRRTPPPTPLMPGVEYASRSNSAYQLSSSGVVPVCGGNKGGGGRLRVVMWEFL